MKLKEQQRKAIREFIYNMPPNTVAFVGACVRDDGTVSYHNQGHLMYRFWGKNILDWALLNQITLNGEVSAAKDDVK